jgi:hypothetical protein
MMLNVVSAPEYASMSFFITYLRLCIAGSCSQNIELELQPKVRIWNYKRCESAVSKPRVMKWSSFHSIRYKSGLGSPSVGIQKKVKRKLH